jgi:hypothetical protein
VLDNDTRTIRLKADYVKGDHVFTFGYEQEEKETFNLFVPFERAQVLFFGGLEALANREWGLILYGNSTTGNPIDAASTMTLTTDSFFVQDEWTVSDTFTLKYGVRFEEDSNSTPVPRNDAFAARNGFDNTFNLDGNKLVLPRIGFNWAATDRLTVRGGAGLFGGGVPLINLSNSYAGNGVTRNIVCGACIGAAFGLYGSIGVDYEADFSKAGLGDDWSVSAEVIFSDVKDGYNIYEGRRTAVGSAPDGRTIYDFPADGDYIVTNTGRGGGTVWSLGLAKSWDTDSGRFDATFGYTSTSMEEVRSYNRFINYEAFAFDGTTDYNNMGLSPSKYEIEDKISATFNWENEIWGDNTTRATLIYTGRSGRHYSHVMGNVGGTFGGTFLADFGSEGDNPGSQLFYVPTGINDPIVTGDSGFLQELDNFISSNSCLAHSRGTTVRRNGCETGFTNVWSLRLMQEISIGGDKKLELIMDIENLLNLFNSDWGRVDSYAAPSNVAVANVAISDDGTQYVYSRTSSAGPIVPAPAVALLPSAYRIQFGARFRF